MDAEIVRMPLERMEVFATMKPHKTDVEAGFISPLNLACKCKKKKKAYTGVNFSEIHCSFLVSLSHKYASQIGGNALASGALSQTPLWQPHHFSTACFSTSCLQICVCGSVAHEFPLDIVLSI